MSFIYNMYKYYFSNKEEDIKDTIIINSDNKNIKEHNEDNINIVICSGSGCKNMVFVKINKPKFPLCTKCIKKYSN
jgi:hypothetical protein